jgi:hypothetical protein
MIVPDGYNIGRDLLVEKAVEGGRWKVRRGGIPRAPRLFLSSSDTLLIPASILLSYL